MKLIIRAITKTKKKVIDCYTVYFFDGSCLTLSSNPNSPQGVSQFGSYFGINDADFESYALEGKLVNSSEEMINFYELPPIVQAQIEKVLSEKEEK